MLNLDQGLESPKRKYHCIENHSYFQRAVITQETQGAAGGAVKAGRVGHGWGRAGLGKPEAPLDFRAA